MESEDLSVLSTWAKYAGAPNPLYAHLCSQASRLLDARADAVAAIAGVDGWRQRQAELRQTLLDVVGPFPERTPLQPRVIDVMPKRGYHVEKLVFESQPGLYVTACLFVPERLQGKAPGIVYLLGHSDTGFRAQYSQVVILNLVRKGFVVLTIDPLGQGERVQYFDAEIGRSRVGTCTYEHSHAGAQCFVTGSCLARYRTWDAIRAVDYLVSRDEVDPGRIGATGCSGGGTMTTYLAAFDERILAASPANYITSFRRLLESIGPQDAEQNFPGGILKGIEHADMLAVRAPKPVLIQSTTRDFFSIQGARETFAELKGIYRALGAEGNVRMVEDDYVHGTTQKTREALYAFFQEYLAFPGDPTDEDVEYLSPEELRVTETGQVSTSLGGETVFSINAREAGALVDKLSAKRWNLGRHLPEAVEAAKRLSGYVAPEGSPAEVFTGRYRRDGYVVEKYMLPGEGDYMLPLLLMVPEGDGPHPALIYLRPEGKAVEAAADGEMAWFVRQGYAVLAADLLGYGELEGTRSGRHWQPAFTAILIGRSVVGVEAGDIVRLVRFLQNRPDINAGRISALGRGEIGPALLHAAAFEPAISKLALVESFTSYRSMVMNRFYSMSGMTMVADALTAYDLPDLAAALAPRDLLLVNVIDQNGNRAGSELIEQDLKVVKDAYAAVEAGRLEIRHWEQWDTIADVFGAWLGQGCCS